MQNYPKDHYDPEAVAYEMISKYQYVFSFLDLTFNVCSDIGILYPEQEP